MSANSGPPPGKGERGERGTSKKSEALVYNNDGTFQRLTAGGDEATETPGEVEASSSKRSSQRGAESAPRRQTAAASPDEFADDLGDLIEEKFMGLLRARLAQKGGSLNETDVAEMGVEFRQQLGQIKTIFMDAVTSYAKANVRGRDRERNPDRDERKNTFRRLLVSRFEAQLVPDGALEREPNRLSRRILPGFFSALTLMLGQENLAKFESQADQLVINIRERMGDSFSWSDVYKDKETRQLLLKADILMAQHFKDVGKRIDWLVAVINGNLIPMSPNLAGADWSMSEKAARHMLRGLFSDIGRTLANKDARDTLAKRIDQPTLSRIEALVSNLK